MKNKKICVIGLGYVGLPLAVEFGKKYTTIGFDVNSKRIEELKKLFDRTLETTEAELKEADKLTYTTEILDCKEANIFIITVPTPIDKNNRPDLEPLETSSASVAKIIKKGDIIIYESTVYPGVTEDVCIPIIEKNSGLKFNTDFFAGYSPERINPGDKERTLTKILKITSGSTPEIAQVVDELYNSILTAGTYKASSIKVAEAAKVIENTQRDVNIALINELAMIFNTMGIDTNEVLEAAGTKWNFIKLKPGLVGGHCIGVDPYYLTFKAEELGYKPNLILAARIINNGMAKYIADNTIKQMIFNDIKIKHSNILILGVTFKEDCPDMRNSKVIDIIEELKIYGCNIDVYDPWVDKNEQKKHYKHGLINDPFIGSKKYDAVIIAVAHKQFKLLTKNEFDTIQNTNSVIIDVKGIKSFSSWKM